MALFYLCNRNVSNPFNPWKAKPPLGMSDADLERDVSTSHSGQMLQSHMGLNSHHLQALLVQQHQQQFLAYQQQKELMEAGRKQLEQLVQMNILHQAQIHPDASKTFLEQLQMTKETFAHSSRENKLHFKGDQNELMRSNGNLFSNDQVNANLLAALGAGREAKSSPRINGSEFEPKNGYHEASKSLKPTHALYSHGLCRWTGCEAAFDSFESFAMHLNREHVLDERSTAQTRVQDQIVSQLEQRLEVEKERLEAMKRHLHPPRPSPSKSPENPFLTVKNNRDLLSHNVEASMRYPPVSPQSPQTQEPQQKLPNFLAKQIASRGVPFNCTSHTRSAPVSPEMISRTPFEEITVKMEPGSFQAHEEPPLSSTSHQRSSSGNSGHNGGGPTRMSRCSHIDPENEITRNRDFYRSHDVRPPFTYAALIRQAIVESHDRQLTLNEIYTWFQSTFAFFRRNAATWKNAVRHNLSLHKCFRRVENVKGAVWTVDELEYHRRRPQRGPAIGGSGSSEKSGFSYDNSESNPSGLLQQNLGLHGEYRLQGLCREEQAAYLHGLEVQLSSSFQQHSLNLNNNGEHLVKQEKSSSYESRSDTGMSSPVSAQSRSPGLLDQTTPKPDHDREADSRHTMLEKSQGNQEVSDEESMAEDLSNGPGPKFFDTSKFRYDPYNHLPIHRSIKAEQQT